jgi:gamma-glutamylputrescine oxidase
MVGSSDAQALSAMAREAVADVKARVNDHAIACDLAHGHYHVGLKPRHDRELAEWIDEAVTFGDDQLQFINGSSVLEHVASPIYTSALFDPDGGHLHPLNYTLGLAEAALKSGVSIFENSPAQSICHRPKPQIKTAEGEITAEHLLICTNALIDGLEPMMDRMIMPVGTYIMATEPLDAPRANALIAGNAAVADINFVLNYFRLSGDHRMLFGGRVSYSKIDPRNIGAVMAQTMRHYFPQLVDTKVSYAWGGHVAITMNRLPQFGRLGPATYFAHGFSGHGVALTGLAGKLMAEAVAGSAERFDVFSRIPHRRFPGGRLLRTPALVLAMLYLRLRDML